MKQNNQYKMVLHNVNADVTTIENTFITEYMPAAQGAYIKVYLYGLMASRNAYAIPLNNTELADLFHITEGDVMNAWQYWKDQGIIDIRYSGNEIHEIIYYNINECLLNGKPVPQKTDSNNDGYDQEIAQMFEQIQAMYGSRMLSKTDIDTFISWIDDYGFSPTTIILLVEYGLNMLNGKGNTYSASNARNYLKAIAANWHQDGVRSFEDAESWLNENQKKRRYYFEILNALGIHRNPSRSELQLMDAWQKDFNFSQDVINYAIERAATPTIRYVNGILQHWHDRGWTTREAIKSGDQKPVSRSKSVKETEQVSEQDKKRYQEKMQSDDDWLNSIEDIFQNEHKNV